MDVLDHVHFFWYLLLFHLLDLVFSWKYPTDMFLKNQFIDQRVGLCVGNTERGSENLKPSLSHLGQWGWQVFSATATLQLLLCERQLWQTEKSQRKSLCCETFLDDGDDDCDENEEVVGQDNVIVNECYNNSEKWPVWWILTSVFLILTCTVFPSFVSSTQIILWLIFAVGPDLFMQLYKSQDLFSQCVVAYTEPKICVQQHH